MCQSYALTCDMRIYLRDEVPKQVRTCHLDNVEVIDYCPGNQNNFCKLYYLTVYHYGRYYSNPHCAQCHGISLNATTCTSSNDQGQLAFNLAQSKFGYYSIQILQTYVFGARTIRYFTFNNHIISHRKSKLNQAKAVEKKTDPRQLSFKVSITTKKWTDYLGLK